MSGIIGGPQNGLGPGGYIPGPGNGYGNYYGNGYGGHWGAQPPAFPGVENGIQGLQRIGLLPPDLRPENRPAPPFWELGWNAKPVHPPVFNWHPIQWNPCPPMHQPYYPVRPC